MMNELFVTATDTDAGKTLVAEIILQAASLLGLSSIAMKPISAGCEVNEQGQLRNSDALTLQHCASFRLPYEQINPFAYQPPIAPHIAAQLAVASVTTDACADSKAVVPTIAGIQSAYQQLAAQQPDVLLCEGAGGWQLPINDSEYLSEFVARQGIPVVMVVPMRLGCLNHALLTAQAIRAAGLELKGWFANQLSPQPMPYYHENVASLQARLAAPLIAELPFFPASAAKTAWLQAQLEQPRSPLRYLLAPVATEMW